MMRRQYPHNRAYRRFGAISATTALNAHAVTIARQDAEIRKMRAALDDIDALVIDFNLRQATFAALLVTVSGIRRILMEWKSRS